MTKTDGKSIAKPAAKSAARAKSPPGPPPGVRLDGPSPADQSRAAGKAMRARAPRGAHADLPKPSRHRDPVALIIASDADRLPNLIPVRHSRMLESPFAFFRGTAALQAQDLGKAASSGIVVQCCGDAHLMNFGGFATPERRFIFDINDFDETHPAPFEWDVKRLAASFVLAARWRGFPDPAAREIATTAARSYRRRIARAAELGTLDAWYATVTWDGVLEEVADDPESAKRVSRKIAAATRQTNEHVFHKLVAVEGGVPRIMDQPPLLYHPAEQDLRVIAGPFLARYALTLREDYRPLLARLRFADAALKVVGVGSVGTRCYVALMLGVQNEPMFLQIKEARNSVLAGHAGSAPWGDNGERVVVGQRLMQAASDMFLGWTKGPEGRHFYVRQLRDMKSSVALETMDAPLLGRYAGRCGETLARAHAKAGDAACIAGYVGGSDHFDDAIGRYAMAYADQAEKDYKAFRKAAAAGRISTSTQGGEIQSMIR